MRRNAVIIAAVLAIVAAGTMFFAPSVDYSRANLTTALLHIGSVRSALEVACAEGTFSSKQKMEDLNLGDSDPKAFVHRLELIRVSPDKVRVKTTFTDIYTPLQNDPLKIVAQGAFMEIESTCSAERKYSWRPRASTVEPRYLPSPWRVP